MSTPVTVTYNVVTADDIARPGVPVEARLIGAGDLADSGVVTGTVRAVTRTDGSFSLALLPNNAYQGTDSYYQVRISDGPTYCIAVPESAVALDLWDLRVDPRSLAPAADPALPLFLLRTERGVIDGVASLDGDGKVPAGQLPAGGGSVPTTRRVNTTAPLTGGGALSADLTLAITTGSTSATVAAGDAPAAAVTAHEGAADPHAQYLRQAEADVLYDAAGAASTAVAGHVAAGDPHPLYLTAAEADAAYAALVHTHAISAVTGLQAALDGKLTQAAADVLYAALVHTHAQADVTGLVAALAAKAVKPVIRQAWITSGDVNTLPNTAGNWQALAGFVLAIPAAVGDYVELSVNGMRKDATGNAWLDQGVLDGSTVVRFLSTGGAVPGLEGDPGWYVPTAGIIGRSSPRGFVVTSDDLDSGEVRFCMAVKSNGTGILYASTNYPFFWRAVNYGPIALS